MCRRLRSENGTEAWLFLEGFLTLQLVGLGRGEAAVRPVVHGAHTRSQPAPPRTRAAAPCGREEQVHVSAGFS